MSPDTPAVKPVIATAAQHYAIVEATWPPGKLPPLTEKMAISAAKHLWRCATGKAWAGTWKRGYGNHRTYPRYGVFTVNPQQGWKRMVHDLSHAAHRRVNPKQKPHSGGHARIEIAMIKEVLAKGWLEPQPQPRPRLLELERLLSFYLTPTTKRRLSS